MLSEILHTLGLNEAAALLNAPAVMAQAKQRIANGKALAAQLNIQGVPSVHEKRGSQWFKIDNSLLLHR